MKKVLVALLALAGAVAVAAPAQAVDGPPTSWRGCNEDYYCEDNTYVYSTANDDNINVVQAVLWHGTADHAYSGPTATGQLGGVRQTVYKWAADGSYIEIGWFANIYDGCGDDLHDGCYGWVDSSPSAGTFFHKLGNYVNNGVPHTFTIGPAFSCYSGSTLMYFGCHQLSMDDTPLATSIGRIFGSARTAGTHMVANRWAWQSYQNDSQVNWKMWGFLYQTGTQYGVWKTNLPGPNCLWIGYEQPSTYICTGHGWTVSPNTTGSFIHGYLGWDPNATNYANPNGAYTWEDYYFHYDHSVCCIP